MIALLGLLAVAVYAQLAISPGTPTVKAGATQTFTASGGTGPYTYSLTSGSAGSINSSSGVYTAPSSVTVKHAAGGCMLLPPDHIYNTRVDALPAHSSSTSLMTATALGGTLSIAGNIGFSPSFGTNIMTDATGTFDAVFLYTPLNDATFQILSWPWLKRESGIFSDPFATGDLFADRHVASVNRETCVFSDLYNNYPSPPGNVAQACALCTAQSGVKYNGFDFTLPTTGATDAAGMAQQPVALRLEDIRSGELRHALRFTLNNLYIEPAYQWPATANAVPYCVPGTCWKYGMYVRLKSSYDISSYSATAQIILLGLKRYGMILTDGGSNWDIQTSTDLMADPDARAAIREVNAVIASSNFEVVDTSSMDITAASGAVNLSNGYVTPTQYAEVVVTDAAMATASTRVALQGIVVGTSYHALNVYAGEDVQIDHWVTGTSTQTVTWAKVSGDGSVDSGGVYSAPSSITSPTQALISITSTVDTNAIAYVKMMVFPDNDSGAIRIDVGNSADSTDGGHTYWKDSYSAFETGLISYSCCSDPGASWVGSPPRYQKDATVFYADTMFHFRLPNGNYRVTASYAAGNSSGALADHSFECHHESQSQIGARNVSLQNYLMGYSSEIPMKVTDGTAYYALRKKNDRAGVDNRCLLSALTVVPDASSPSISIDTAGDVADITIGKTKQFYAVGWYMANTVTWSVQSGPGSIDSDGLYTAPSTPPSSTTPVTVRATSTVDSSIAEYTFYFVFGDIDVSCSPATVSRGQTATCSASIDGVAYSNVTWTRSGSQGSIHSTTGVYTAPSSITDGDITITATSTDLGTETGTATLSLNQLVPVIYVNAGQTLGSYTDSLSIVWPADTNGYWTPSDTPTYGEGSATITGAANGRSDTYRYQRYRYQNQTFTYTSAAVPSGTYRVTLMFAEFRSTAQNSPANIDICGQRVLSNFNFVTAAGAVRTAYDQTFDVPCSGGSVVVDFAGLSGGSSYGAGVNGIIIEDLGPIASSSSGTGMSGGAAISGKVTIQ